MEGKQTREIFMSHTRKWCSPLTNLLHKQRTNKQKFIRAKEKTSIISSLFFFGVSEKNYQNSFLENAENYIFRTCGKENGR
jgi:hypothetical protein